MNQGIDGEVMTDGKSMESRPLHSQLTLGCRYDKWRGRRCQRTRRVWLYGLNSYGLSVLLLLSPVMAQAPVQSVKQPVQGVKQNAATPAGNAAAIEAATVAQDWAQVRKQVGALEVTAPEQALARYQEFYKQHGHKSSAVSGDIFSLMVQIYWSQLGQRDKAAETYQEALQKLGSQPAGARLRKEWELLQSRHKLKVSEIDLKSLTSASPSGNREDAHQNAVPAIVIPDPAHVKPLVLPQAVAISPLEVRSVNWQQTAALIGLVERLSEAGLSAEQIEVAWRESGLGVAQLFQALQSSGTLEKRTQAAGTHLVGLLARHGAELLSEPEKLPESVQFLLAEYYTSVQDARAEGIYRHQMAKLKQQGPPQARQIKALWNLHKYYLAAGQKGQAADLLMTAPEYTTHPYELGNAAIYAARLYQAAGQSEKAQAAYAWAKRTGFDWGVGVALFDQASTLIEQGQHAEARKLLTTPVEGKYADQMKVALLSLLSRSYYLMGDFEAAKRYSAQALQQVGSLELLKNEGLEAQVAGARQIERWVLAWEKQPVVVSPQALRVELKDETERSVTNEEATGKSGVSRGDRDAPSLLGRMSLRTPHTVPVQVRSENPAIRATVVSDGPWSGQRELYYEQELRVEWVVPGAAREMETKLVLSSPAWGDQEIAVPVQVRKATKDKAAPGTAAPGMASGDKAVQGKQDKPGPSRE